MACPPTRYLDLHIAQGGPLGVGERPDTSCHPLEHLPLITRKGSQRNVEMLAIQDDLITGRKVAVLLTVLA